MKKLTLLTLLTLAAAIPLQADDDSRHQSYVSYDDGGTLVMPGGFYYQGMPPTSRRMARYAEHAPDLAMARQRLNRWSG